MTMTVHVGSRTQDEVVVPVEGYGWNQNEATRAAIQFARARHGISHPIALSEHEAAVRMRRQFVEKHAPKMPNLNGHSVPFWKTTDRTSSFYR